MNIPGEINPEIGMRIKINGAVCEIKTIDGDRAIIETVKGTRVCYKILGLKESEVVRQTGQTSLF